MHTAHDAIIGFPPRPRTSPAGPPRVRASHMRARARGGATPGLLLWEWERTSQATARGSCTCTTGKSCTEQQRRQAWRGLGRGETAAGRGAHRVVEVAALPRPASAPHRSRRASEKNLRDTILRPDPGAREANKACAATATASRGGMPRPARRLPGPDQRSRSTRPARWLQSKEPTNGRRRRPQAAEQRSLAATDAEEPDERLPARY
uniref:Uncharacterized protein n=1 Tax=Setaria viridis TaxID=4556 RepID=A0A4U6WBE0_SETVI|nr:hypothetical protein SEVIR_2G346225v2 [Setaria viridis]